jgi:hypothetical protein
MSGQLPPLFAITPDDHAGYVAVANYTFLVLMLCLVATRVFTRWYVVRFIKFDDAVLTGAAVSLGFLFSFLSACSVARSVSFPPPVADESSRNETGPGSRSEHHSTDGSRSRLG